MTRGTVVALVALVCLIGVVVFFGIDQMDRDRAALSERFGMDQLQQVEQAAQAVRTDLNRISDDLLFFARLARDPRLIRGNDQHAALEAMLAIVKEYEIVQFYGGDGQLLLEAADPSGLPEGEREAAAAPMRQTAASTLQRPPGSTTVTEPITLSTGHAVRVFAMSLRPEEGETSDVRLVLLLVETGPFFSKLRLAALGQSSRLIFLSANGQPARLTDRTLAAKIGEIDAKGPGTLPGVAGLVENMRRGESGTLMLPPAEAAELGLPADEAVAAYAAVRTNSLSTWSFGTISTLARLRIYERGIFLRLGPMVLVIVLLLAGFGAYIVLEARRAGMLRQRLMLADRLGHLNEKMEKMVDNIPTGVIALSSAGRITMMNRMLREKLGAANDRTLAEAFHTAPSAVAEHLQQLVEEAERSARVVSVHGERLSLFGQEGQYSIHAVPLESRFDDARVLLVLEDQSEVRALSSQLVRAEKLATVGVLAAGIAHEIGTPLGVVRGRAEYILGKLGPEHGQAPGMKVIVEQIDFVTRTIRQLLDFARVKPASVSPVPVSAVARTVVDLLSYEAERRKIELSADVPDALPPVAADTDQLQQVLVALTVNAIDACAQGGHVRLSATVDDAGGTAGWRRLAIRVTDDGTGISPENRAQVFDPFFTTKKRGQGTGLGLTIAAQIVRNHGGDIELDSELGRGTTVIIRWPCARASVRGLEAAESKSKEAS